MGAHKYLWGDGTVGGYITSRKEGATESLRNDARAGIAARRASVPEANVGPARDAQRVLSSLNDSANERAHRYLAGMRAASRAAEFPHVCWCGQEQGAVSSSPSPVARCRGMRDVGRFSQALFTDSFVDAPSAGWLDDGRRPEAEDEVDAASRRSSSSCCSCSAWVPKA